MPRAYSGRTPVSPEPLGEATLLLACGMHYNCHFDPINKACLLVADVPAQSVRAAAVFALQIVLARTSAEVCCGINTMSRWN
jgi:hypothetical protein